MQVESWGRLLSISRAPDEYFLQGIFFSTFCCDCNARRKQFHAARTNVRQFRRLQQQVENIRRSFGFDVCLYGLGSVEKYLADPVSFSIENTFRHADRKDQT